MPHSGVLPRTPPDYRPPLSPVRSFSLYPYTLHLTSCCVHTLYTPQSDLSRAAKPLSAVCITAESPQRRHPPVPGSMQGN